MVKRDGVTVVECDRCPELCESRQNIVNGEGKRRAKVAVVGQAPGREEDKKARPFIGPAGKTLRNWLRAAGFHPERDVYYLNATRCIGPKDKDGKEREPQDEEITNCRDFLLDELEWVDPDIIVPAGGIALQTLYEKVGITQLRGAVLWHDELGKKMVPILHPASAFHVWSNEKYGVADLTKAYREGKNPTKMPEGLGKYQVCLDVESIEHLADLVEQEAAILSIDCVTPETPVLRADLTWVPAGDIRTGDEVISLDEEKVAPFTQRRYRRAKITNHGQKETDLYELTLETGERLRCTGSHRWLVQGGMPKNRAGRLNWVRADEMAKRLSRRGVGGQKPKYTIPRMLPTWNENRSYDAGLLAGAFDADGTFTGGIGKGGLYRYTLNFGQRPGRFFDRVLLALKNCGFDYTVSETPPCQTSYGQQHYPQMRVSLKGGYQEHLRFLGQIRPVRLLEKWYADDRLRGHMAQGKERVKIMDVRPVGRGVVVQLESESKTYLAAGFPSHNTETTSLDWQTGNILCVGVSWAPGTAFVVPVLGQHAEEMWSKGDRKRVWEALRRIFESDVPKIAQNGKFDALFLKHDLGIELKNFVFDTMLAYHLFHEEKGHSLDTLCGLYTNMGDYSRDARPYKQDMAECPLDKLWKYQAADADCTLRVALILDEMLDSEPKFRWILENITMPMAQATMHMEERGVLVDMERAERLIETYDGLVAEEKAKLFAVPGVPEKLNYRSDPQVRKLLFETLGLPESSILTNKTKLPSVKQDALLEIGGSDPHPVIPPLLRIKGLEQVMKMFLKGAKPEAREKGGKGLVNRISQVDNRLHTSMRVDGTETGRLCVPVDAEILTATGWKRHNQLSLGEKVLGYDVQTGESKWTHITDIFDGRGPLGTFRLRSADLKTSSRSSEMIIRCTPEHHWVGEYFSIPGRKSLLRGYVAAKDLPKDRVRVLLATRTPAPSGWLSVTPQEAAIVGWAITDGHIINRNKPHHRPSLSICVNKTTSVAALDQLLSDFPHTRNHVARRGAANRDSVNFYIGTDAFSSLWGLVQELPRWLPGLSAEARRAMFEAMMEADGSRRGCRKCRGRKDCDHVVQERFGALRSSIALDTFVTLCALEGRLVTASLRPKGGPDFIDLHVRQRPWTTRAKFTAHEKEEAVWCPTTETGNWIMRQGTAVVLTGNSHSPNIANVVGEGKSEEGAPIREIFIAPPGRVLMIADFSQIELRGLAYIAGDERLVEVMEGGMDVHDFVARELFGVPEGTDVTKEQRRQAKVFNFGLGYGMTKASISKKLGCSEGRAEELLQMYFGIIEKLPEYFARQRRAIKSRGVTYNIFGRRRLFYGVKTMQHFRGYRRQMGHIYRESYNFPVQSSASDIHSLATVAVDCDPWLRDNEAWLVGSIHDSVMIEVAAEKAEKVARYVQELMQRTALEVTTAVGRPWIVPIEVEWGPRWEVVTHKLRTDGIVEEMEKAV